MDSSFRTIKATLHSKTFSLISCDVVSWAVLCCHANCDFRGHDNTAYLDICPLFLAELLELIHEYSLRHLRHRDLRSLLERVVVRGGWPKQHSNCRGGRLGKAGRLERTVGLERESVGLCVRSEREAEGETLYYKGVRPLEALHDPRIECSRRSKDYLARASKRA